MEYALREHPVRVLDGGDGIVIGSNPQDFAARRETGSARSTIQPV